MAVQVPPLLLGPLTGLVDYGLAFTRDRRLPDPRKTHSAPSSFHGSPPRPASNAQSTDRTAGSSVHNALAAIIEPSPPETPQCLTPVPPPTSRQAPAATNHSDEPPATSSAHVPMGPQVMPAGANGEVLPSSPHMSWPISKTRIFCEPSTVDPKAIAFEPTNPVSSPESSIPSSPATSVLPPSCVALSPDTEPTTISSSTAALPSSAPTPSTSLAPTLAMKSTAHSPPLNSISGVSSAAHLLPAAPIPTSNRAKKTDRLGRKQRDKLDHNRERREAQEAEKEVRISNRQASRKRKKEKREAKLEARAAMAPHQESLTEPIELLETTEQAEGSRNEEDTSQMPETDVISTPDAASMSAGLKVDDSAGGVVTADIQHHGNRVSALDTTQAEIDRLFTSISQSTAYEKLLNVCEVSAEEEPLVCPVGEVITRLEGYLENLSTSPSVGESKSGKKKRVKKKKVKNTQSKVATGLQLFVGKSTVPLPSHDEEGPVEVSVDSSSSLISTSGEPVLGLCLTDLGGANLRLRALRTTHFNVEECGSTLEVLGTVATQVQREEKLSPTSVEQSLPLLILSDAATSDPTSILEPTASIITGPSSKTKSKKKKKKKKAKKASAAATPEETSKAGNKAPQSSGPGPSARCQAGGVPIERSSDCVPGLLPAGMPRVWFPAPSETPTHVSAGCPEHGYCSPLHSPTWTTTTTSNCSCLGSELESVASSPETRHSLWYPSWWYPWALLKHLRRLRVHALRCVTKLCNEWQRQWLFIVLCPLLNLKINDYFEHLRVQLYEQGFCDSLNTKWRFLVHAVWKFEGAFARIEGWQQSQDVPASFRLDPPNIDAPRFKDFFAIANDDDRDWMEMDEDVKRSLVVQERYISLCWEDTTVAVGRRRCLGAAS